jgi:hypothetical protein
MMFSKKSILLIITIAIVILLPSLSIAEKEEVTSESLQKSHVFFLKQDDSMTFGTTITADFKKTGIDFKKEPDWGKGKIIRGYFPLDQENKLRLPFAWNKTRRKLYIDSNRNLDLTDDPGNVFSGTKQFGYTYFDKITINTDIHGVNVPIFAKISFMEFGRYSSVTLEIFSSWKSDIDLNGKKWRLYVTDGLDGIPGKGINDKYKIVPLIKGASEQDYTDSNLSLQRYLFLQDQAYKINLAFVKIKDEIQIRAEFIEKKVSTGEIHIEGENISRLFLSGTDHVIIDNPGSLIKIPAGTYTMQQIMLKDKKSKVVYNINPPTDFNLPVEGKQILKSGGPLKNAAIVSRHGRYLYINYKLEDRTGTDITSNNANSQASPELYIYLDGKKIHSGKFTYG